MEMVKKEWGTDAFYYLRFQRHLIALMLIMSVISVFVVLPVNMSGDLKGNVWGGTSRIDTPVCVCAMATLRTDSSVLFRILKVFNPVGCRSEGPWELDPPNKNLHVRKWNITQAAHPDNVYWENMSVQGFRWWLRYLIHFVIFIMLLLFTTPSIFISAMAKLNVTIPFSYLISPTVKQFFPTLLLWMFSTLLPLIVYYSTIKEAHYTRSDENKSMIYKLYIFLLLMVLILPSLGITSLDVVHLLFDGSFKGRIKLECVFLPDQGAFFVNYVITSALSGAAMELLWLPLMDKPCGCFMNVLMSVCTVHVCFQKYQEYRFPYGAMYAWNLCVFTVIMAYSITCPVIVPVGLVYLILKHLVDKHNLRYARKNPYPDRQVHLEAVNLAMVAPIICLIWLYAFSALLEGFMAMTTLFTLAVLSITITICFTLICFGFFKQLSPQSCWVSMKEQEAVAQEVEKSFSNWKVYIFPGKDSADNQTSGTDGGPWWKCMCDCMQEPKTNDQYDNQQGTPLRIVTD
ncbi:CSC1-like protein 2 [Sardina pilchardus]|uniref:CSC1-like protein 2 n=1 Tax=Sardina pilchardus TaxID=27697 RepID=UPI002E0E8F1D